MQILIGDTRISSRQKCKEGNLAYFYDMWGYRLYDYVVQLDADHVPEADYLRYMVAPFCDSAVGYVAAPSICDANASASWAARARLYAEAGLHGAMQAGHSSGFAPLCIGSHYAVRTRALKSIGGLGPELAEDHSTTLLFNANGWRGFFAFNAIAHGDGPECLADSVTQEFQWSRSLMKLLLTVTPQFWKRLPGRTKVQFLFAQFWYPLTSLNMLMICVLPFIALTTGLPLVSVNYLEFLGRFVGITACCIVLVLWIRRQGWLRPVNAKVLSWEAWLFPFVSWPWMFMGVFHAIVSVVLKKELAFRVTPKGRTEVKPMPGRVLLPYTLVVVLTFLFSMIIPAGPARMYHYFTLMNMAVYTIVIWGSIIGHSYDNRMYGVKAVFSSIKGTLWQVICAPCCLGIAVYMQVWDVIGIFTAN